MLAAPASFYVLRLPNKPFDRWRYQKVLPVEKLQGPNISLLTKFEWAIWMLAAPAFFYALRLLNKLFH